MSSVVPGAFGVLGRVDLPGAAESVSRARDYVTGVLARTAPAPVEEAVLLVSEVVSNAIRHSDSGRLPGGRVSVVVACYGQVIHIEVIDDGSATKAPSPVPGTADEPDFDAEGGRGLWLVDHMASAWGWHEAAAGRVVWFQLPYR